MEGDANIFTLQAGRMRARTGEGQEREALKGIRVELCWRGRLFGASDTSQWAPGTGQSNYRHWWHRAAETEETFE